MAAAPSTRLTLHCPGLLAPPLPGAGEALPPRPAHAHLARFLTRAREAPSPGPAARHGRLFALFALFGLEPGDDPPVAPLTRLVDEPRAPVVPCLRADPVHLRPGLNGVTLFDAAALEVSPEEAESLAGALAPLFAERDLALSAPAPGRWYLAAPGLGGADLAVGQPAPGVLAGGDASGRLPGGPRAALWRGLMTEAQMLLHEAAVNREREARGAPAVNSLWLWGGGEAPAPGGALWDGVWGDDPLLAGLARHQGLTARDLPASAQGLLEAAGAGEHLVHLPRAGEAVAGDLEGWAAALEDITRDWLAPLAEALGRRRLGALTLDAGGRRYTATGRDLRRWWRRPRPLKAFLGGG